MKIMVLAALGLLMAWGVPFAQGELPLRSEKDKISYIMGLNVGRNLKRQSVELNPDPFLLGFKHAVSGGKSLLSEEEIRKTMAAFQKSHRAKSMARRMQQGKKNISEGKAFLAANKKKSGVKTTKSGLQYKIVKAGSGKSPGPTDTVEVHYKGTLIDGTVFDSSYKRGKPATFPVNRVIPGWTEVLQLMKPGGQWMVWIPSNLAYGERGSGQVIGPNTTLIFEIKLLSVK